ncbi:hypothetical protein ACFY7F_34505 [Streptomyces griseofuscus]|uniref:hypothetical protein n=1 Tax=Streptomyces griseofuscus TaxID=146922 RepID=UPI0036965D8B
MPQMSKIELHAAIRRDHRGGMKIREIERKYNVSWRAVRKAVDSVWPEPRKHLPPRPTALDPYKPLVDEMLRTDLDAPRRQRHTITRIFHHPVEEHAADLSYQMVRRYVSDRKPQILIESGHQSRHSCRRPTSPVWRPRSTSATSPLPGRPTARQAHSIHRPRSGRFDA